MFFEYFLPLQTKMLLFADDRLPELGSWVKGYVNF